MIDTKFYVKSAFVCILKICQYYSDIRVLIQANKLFKMLYVNRKIHGSAFHTFINRCAIVVHILIKFHCEPQWAIDQTRPDYSMLRVIDHVLGVGP